MQIKQLYIADTLHNTILISDYEKEIISTQIFNRLHNISQNSTAYLTFPTNRTKRFEHSIGTMKLCGDIVYKSFINTSDKVANRLLGNLKKDIINNIIKSNILLNPNSYIHILEDSNMEKGLLENIENLDIKNVFYNGYTPANISDNNRILYLILFQAVRICGLLHDLGHPPFSHITENAINNVYKIVMAKQSNTKREMEFLEILNEYDIDKSGIQLHEKMGMKMTERLVSDLLYSNSHWYQDKPFDEKYFKILVFELVKCIFQENSFLMKTLHKLIDGVLDGDRLDYVSRDPINSGINSGVIEYDRLISCMKIIEKDGNFIFATNVKTLNTVEGFFLKRWNLYKDIINHHRVIKTDSLLQGCIENIMLDFLMKEDYDSEIKGIISKEYILPYDISALWMAIKLASSNTRYFNSLIQWDDGLLYSVLKKHYFMDYYNKNNNISYQLEELLSNKKNYYSLIKNNTDFDLFNQGFDDKFSNSIIMNDSNYKRISELLNKNYNDVPKIYILDSYIETYYDGTFNFKDFIKENTIKFINENYKQEIEDQIIVFKSISSGLKTEPSIYKDDNLVPFTKFSNVKKMLESEKYLMSFIHIYIKFKKNKEQNESSFYKKFLSDLGNYLANKLDENLIKLNVEV